MHVQTVQPTSLAVPINEVKEYLAISGNEDDSMVQRLIFQAADFIESRTKTAIMSQTWALHTDGWTDSRYWIEGAIQIARAPFGSVSSITYLDSDGTQQTLAASEYRVAAPGIYARVSPAKNVSWPTTYGVTSDVTITHTCGYSDQSSVPYVIRQAVKDYCDAVFNRRSQGLTREVLEQLDASTATAGAQVAYG